MQGIGLRCVLEFHEQADNTADSVLLETFTVIEVVVYPLPMAPGRPIDFTIEVTYGIEHIKIRQFLKKPLWQK